MSFGADFIAISVEKLEALINNPSALCQFLRKEAEEQPSESLCIDNAWDILFSCLKSMGMSAAAEGTMLTNLPCAEMGMLITAENVSSLAKDLAECSRTDLQNIVEQLDYDELYHGDYWNENQEDFFEQFDEVVAFYHRVAQRNEAIIYLLT